MPGAVDKTELAAMDAIMRKVDHSIQAMVLFLEIITLFVGRTEHSNLFRCVGYAALFFQYRAYISICMDVLLFSGYILAIIVTTIRIFTTKNVSVLLVPCCLVSVLLSQGIPKDMRGRVFIDGFWVLNVGLFRSNPDLPLLDGSLQQFSRLVPTTLSLSLIFLGVYMLGSLATLAAFLKREKAEGATGAMATDQIKANSRTQAGKGCSLAIWDIRLWLGLDLEVLEDGVAPLDAMVQGVKHALNIDTSQAVPRSKDIFFYSFDLWRVKVKLKAKGKVYGLVVILEDGHEIYKIYLLGLKLIVPALKTRKVDVLDLATFLDFEKFLAQFGHCSKVVVTKPFAP
ncbi:hypothetical protein C8J56DRAFT_895181 [Mycena floridula]|nr:hypothetical protein C8J56DRAFT_895181 [Mycena floridula]